MSARSFRCRAGGSRILVEGKERSFNPRRHNRFMLGYATTVYQQTTTADHVHAILSASSTRPSTFRAATAHEKSLTVHWSARAAETITDLARAIDARGPAECTQFYAHRQHALHRAHLDTPDASKLRTAWQLLSPVERTAIENEDRRHRESIHEHQRPRDRANPWLRTAEPASFATAFGHVARYRTESAAAVAYQRSYDELASALTAATAGITADQPSPATAARHSELLEELDTLTTAATDRAARSTTFRLILAEKTGFTPEDLDRQRAECEHQLRAHRLQEETRDPKAHFEAHARAWCVDAADVLEEGSDLRTRAELGGVRPWFAEGYPEWHQSLLELAARHESLATTRATLPADRPETQQLLDEFDTARQKLDAVLKYHEREERTATRARSYREFADALRDRYVEYYGNTEGRDVQEQRVYERRVNDDHKLLYERAAELAQDLDWSRPHLEDQGIKETEIRQYTQAHYSTGKPTQRHDIHLTH